MNRYRVLISNFNENHKIVVYIKKFVSEELYKYLTKNDMPCNETTNF